MVGKSNSGFVNVVNVNGYTGCSSWEKKTIKYRGLRNVYIQVVVHGNKNKYRGPRGAVNVDIQVIVHGGKDNQIQRGCQCGS